MAHHECLPSPLRRNCHSRSRRVEVEPRSGSLPPGESVAVGLTLTARRVGALEVALPVLVATPETAEGGAPAGTEHEAARVRVSAVGVGARLRFEEAEVDLGLIAVGARKEHRL